MKLLILSVTLFLNACSTCYVPLMEYGSQGGSEYLTTIDLRTDEYVLWFEQWKPGGYENRSKAKQQGHWSCTRNSVEILTKKGISRAEYKEVGENPLGLPETTRVLVFMSSEDDILSNELFYPLEILK